MKRVFAFSPAHITGFFSIQDTQEDPRLAGSLGAGFCIESGTLTSVSRRIFSKKTIITINKRVSKAPVSYKTVELFFQRSNITPEPLWISHKVEVPQGSGLGTSGSGALSLALALNQLYGSPLSQMESVGVAHCAEVYCRTGLGTVVSEMKGGFELRLKEGTPPFGVIDGFTIEKPIYAVFILFGALSTSQSLSHLETRKKINNAFKGKLENLQQIPQPENFLKEASKFSKEVNLFSDRGIKALKILENLGYTSAMLMFGDGVYTFCYDLKEAQNLKKVLKKSLKNDILISRITNQGAHLL